MKMNELAYEASPAEDDAADIIDDGAGRADAAHNPQATQEMHAVPRISMQAFCETHDVAQAIEDAGADRRMSKAHTKVHMGALPRRSTSIARRRHPTSSFSKTAARRMLCARRSRILRKSAIPAPRSW
ncbi:hypothetical protein [Breoghania sp. L-A4]|uniref:hypothetical protein n=1 Tax=Breoghania sp. L-A4 TaxID=2304600 RepID=UPI003204A055